MRALRVLGHTLFIFLIAGGIIGVTVALITCGLRWFGHWGPLYLGGPAVFIGFFLLMLSDRTIK